MSQSRAITSAIMNLVFVLVLVLVMVMEDYIYLVSTNTICISRICDERQFCAGTKSET
jgi:hypothetical protein